MKVLIIDNYDSFTYNLVQYIERVLKAPVDVRRNDQISLKEVADYDKILISPGPGIPLEAGITLDVIREYGSSKSILGVCLGHQAIAEAYGGSIVNLDTVYHGVVGQMKKIVTLYMRALLIGGCLLIGLASTAQARDVPDFTVLAKQNSPAVVNIRTVKTIKGGGPVFRQFQRDPWGREGPFKDFFEKLFISL